MADKWITVLGSFVADLAFRTKKIPEWGETSALSVSLGTIPLATLRGACLSVKGLTRSTSSRRVIILPAARRSSSMKRSGKMRS